MTGVGKCMKTYVVNDDQKAIINNCTWKCN